MGEKSGKYRKGNGKGLGIKCGEGYSNAVR